MGLYSKYILPRIIDVAMRNPETTRLRAEWIPRACGNVLEVGIGSGLNLPFYSPAVSRIYGVDPSRELQQIARERGQIDPERIEFLTQTAEEPLPLADSSIDNAVITWTLCSIPEPAQALQQIRRVLRKEGHLIFIEHGYAPDRSVAKWQDALTPLWKRVGGGCHLNRRIVDILTASGFEIVDLKTHYLPGPRLMTYTYQGVAKIA
ncbi:MAG TPA: class I SAM-dependent methyltransferase [Acidobacteriaceae bacterium]|nr:class I SAM-dependent methyltransferase [Acidobacteriaceae bacterium]